MRRLGVIEQSRTLKEWLSEAPFGLTMTSGYFIVFAHCGVLYVLEQHGLLPERISGSSAGALVTGCWAGGLSAEELSKELLKLQRQDFWDMGWGYGLLKGQKFRDKLRSMLPNTDFKDSRVPAAFAIFSILSMKTEVIAKGDIPTAIHASCAVPFLCQPVKVGGRFYLDGGIADRPGLAGMPEGQRVLIHHLASQSPWRFKLSVPNRSNTVSLIVEDLPRVSPSRLEMGRLAFDRARQATEEALKKPFSGNSLSI